MTNLNFSKALQLKLFELGGGIELPVSFWGNSAFDMFCYNFNYDDYKQQFDGPAAREPISPRIIIIVGPINKKQLRAIEDEINRHSKTNPIVVSISGPLPAAIARKSSQIVNDISNHIDVDLELKQTSLNLELFTQELIKLLRTRHEFL